MLAKLTLHQFLVLAAVAVVWGLVLIWILNRKSKTGGDDRFTKLMEWRIYQNKPHGTVDEWIESTSEQKGAPAPIRRVELALAWTAMAGVAASYLLFEWTRVV
jgi:hypothetical protein